MVFRYFRAFIVHCSSEAKPFVKLPLVLQFWLIVDSCSLTCEGLRSAKGDAQRMTLHLWRRG